MNQLFHCIKLNSILELIIFTTTRQIPDITLYNIDNYVTLYNKSTLKKNVNYTFKM